MREKKENLIVSDYMKKFSKSLKEIRESKGLKQSDVADKLGIHVSTYANWEQGRRKPDVEQIYCLIAIFEISANDLLDI